MRNGRALGGLVGVFAAAIGLVAGESKARACGGEFVPPTENETVVTDHRMILAIGQQQTSLYDEIEFKGLSSSFAWVLPIKGTATVALSADILFASLDQLTATQVTEPPTNCPPPPSCGEPFAESGFAAADAGAATGHGAVTVTAQQQVGPYETVQLHSTDPNALNAWLTSHGFAIPTAVAPVIAAYVADQFDFLAMKLAPGKGVTAMRPVRVTTQGASPVLPLRMVSVGTGATTGITLWVVASSRWEPANFPFFTITDSQLAWDWTTNTSTYEAVRKSEEAKYGGKGWQVESSIDLNEYSLQDTVQFGGQFGRGGSGAVSSAPGYLPVGDGGASDGGSADGGGLDAGPANVPDGGYQSAAQVEQADFDALFVGGVNGSARVTRIRSDIAHAALSADLTLQASTDQTELSNVYSTTREIGEPECPVYNNSCNVTGNVPRSEALAAASGTSGGCTAAPTSSSTRSPLGLGILLGLVGFGAMRARRKRAAQG